MSKGPYNKPSSDNALPPVTSGPGHVFSRFVDKIKVGPQAKLRIPLGRTFDENPPKGFAIEVSPKLAEEIVTVDIMTKGTATQYEYLLDVTNRSRKTVSAEIWQL